jgi:hypothetical protein
MATVTIQFNPTDEREVKQIITLCKSLVPTETAQDAPKTTPDAIKQANSDKKAPVEENSTTEPETPQNEEVVKTETPPDEKPVSKTDVRAAALVLSKAGKQDALVKIFSKYGGKKLSDISENDYGAVLKDLEAANNG